MTDVFDDLLCELEGFRHVNVYLDKIVLMNDITIRRDRVVSFRRINGKIIIRGENFVLTLKKSGAYTLERNKSNIV